MKDFSNSQRNWREIERPTLQKEVRKYIVKFCIENYIALKEEFEMLKEEIVLKEEDLNKYQRHCDSVSDEVRLYDNINEYSYCSIRNSTMNFLES